MAFNMNLSPGTGDIIPIVKYDARAGRMQRVDRIDGVAVPTDITAGFAAVFDFENIEKGWITFGDFGPDFHLVPMNDPLPPKPSEGHRLGVRCLLKLASDIGGDVREIATVARSALAGLDELHDAYMAGVKAHPGQLPVCVLVETMPIVTGAGAKKATNYKPVFKIETWVPRPADLTPKPRGMPATPASTGNGSAAAPSFRMLDTAPSTGAKVVAPPSPSPAAARHARDFG
jgi:hypothetical protein